MAETATDRVLPYGSFKAFENFLAQMAAMEPGLPDHIDRSVLQKKSGAEQTALLNALAFLGLIDRETGKTLPKLKDLVRAQTANGQEWQTRLAETVNDAYAPVLGNINVRTTTPAKLEGAFREARVKPGQMLEKSIRFYVKALQAAGVGLPEHLMKTRRQKAQGAAKKKETGTKTPQKPRPGGGPTGSAVVEDSLPANFDRLPIPGRPGAFIQYPKDLTDSDVRLFEAQLAALRIFLEAKGGEQ